MPLVVVGGCEFHIVEIEPPNAGVVEALAPSFESSDFVFLPEFSTLLLAISSLGLSLLGLAYASSPGLVLPLMAIYGVTGWAVATPNNYRLTALAPTLPGVVISFISGGICLGAIAEGILLDHHGTGISLCIVATAAAGVALGLQVMTTRPLLNSG